MKGNKGQIREKKPDSVKKRKVRFELSAEPGSQVCIAGTFNSWNPTTNPLKEKPDGGHFKVTLGLEEGTHEYKFIVNGRWMSDPKCPEFIADGCGAMNSVLKV